MPSPLGGALTWLHANKPIWIAQRFQYLSNRVMTVGTFYFDFFNILLSLQKNLKPAVSVLFHENIDKQDIYLNRQVLLEFPCYL